jgi:hypothetical protein
MANKLTSVAIKFDARIWSLPPPARHHDVIRWIAESNGEGINGPDEQGFMTNDCEFVDRKEALIIALKANQVLDINNVRANQLFSEDLW